MFCEVRNAKELLAVVRKANINRAVRHTAMNTHSSRSHSILQVGKSNSNNPPFCVVRHEMDF